MESIQRLCCAHSQRLIPLSLSISCSGAGALIHTVASKATRHGYPNEVKIEERYLSKTPRSRLKVSASGWFSGFGAKKSVLPETVKAGDPVLHEPTQEVVKEEIGSEKIEKIIEDMIAVMRNGPGVGLAAPQIGIPLKIIVLEDTKEFISYARPQDIESQDRRPFDLLVIINPTLRYLSNKKAIFFEGCLSVDGFRAAVERYLEVEVSGLGRDGRPIKLEARGWQARILQHEFDHLHGTLYVDKMVKRTFRTVENLELPLPAGCPSLGVQ